MAQFSVRVEGLIELSAIFNQLGEELGFSRVRSIPRIPLRNAMRDIVEPVIVANTPIDTGRLRDSVQTTVRNTRNSEVFSGTFDRNTLVRAVTGWTWQGQSLWFQALAVEYGTRYQAPQAILRNALQNNVSRVVQRFSQLFGPRLERRAEQIRRQLQGGRRRR